MKTYSRSKLKLQQESGLILKTIVIKKLSRLLILQSYFYIMYVNFQVIEILWNIKVNRKPLKTDKFSWCKFCYYSHSYIHFEVARGMKMRGTNKQYQTNIFPGYVELRWTHNPDRGGIDYIHTPWREKRQEIFSKVTL